jgi:hypothetical protein
MATFSILSQALKLFSHPEHHRERVGVNHLLGNRASFLGAPPPVFGVVKAFVRRSRDCWQRVVGRLIATSDVPLAKHWGLHAAMLDLNPPMFVAK